MHLDVRGRIVLACCALALLSACATDDAPTSSGGGGGSGRVVKANPTLSSDIQEIFDRRGCSNNSCHGTIAQGGLDLRTGNSYAELVNVLSTRPGLYLVRPGHAQDSSYLVDKLDGTGVGIRMPQGAVPLDSIDMQNIINWIHMGAANN